MTPPRGMALASLSILFASGSSRAGPPYATDDPEPVELHHWEAYLASQSSHDADGWSGTAPHVEVNYGALPNLQLHAIAPLAFAAPVEGKTRYGYGDTEIGAKFRFIQESDCIPQVGTFPLLEIPTGPGRLGLGTTQIYLPLWLQKSFGDWTTYGGAGYWLNWGAGNRNWWFLGWQVQRQVVDGLSVGLELFHETQRVDGADSETRFNVGAVIDLSKQHHVLVSAGRDLWGPTTFQSYVAYQLTLGPDTTH